MMKEQVYNKPLQRPTTVRTVFNENKRRSRKGRNLDESNTGPRVFSILNIDSSF
jgi:hypothetical protein